MISVQLNSVVSKRPHAGKQSHACVFAELGLLTSIKLQDWDINEEREEASESNHLCIKSIIYFAVFLFESWLGPIVFID